MKKIIITIFIAAFAINAHAQWQWAKHIHSSEFDGAARFCKDANGDIYLGGYFNGPVGYFPNDTLTAIGDDGVFLIKYNPSGNRIWLKQLDGWGSDPQNVGALTYDASTNTVIASVGFSGCAFWDNDTVCSTFGGVEGAIAKFDLNGTCLWALSFGGPGDDYSGAVDVDNLGNIYICANNSSIAFLNGDTLQPGTFLAKFDPQGGLIWHKQISGMAQLFSNAFQASFMKIIGNDMFIIGDANTDTLNIDTVQFANPNAYGVVLARFNLSGDVQWAKLLGYPIGLFGYGAVDNSGNSYISGTFSGDTAYFGSTIIGNGNLSDMFLAKYDVNGNFIWVRQSFANGPGGANARGCFLDGDDKIYITGKFRGTAQFGTYSQTSNTGSDAFVARYEPNGDCIGVAHFGSSFIGAHGLAVIATNDNEPVISAVFVDTISIAGNTYGCGEVYGDIVIAKHDIITGIAGEERIVNNELIIYANPTAGKCNIIVPDDFVHEKNLTLNIYDNTGKLIQQKLLQMNDGKIKLNLEAEARGIYTVTLSSKKKSYYGKIVFE
ncbi:MAG TPA: T9SS type A sorting domain-containing protein [Bacteroidia bacterium]|nr:T9SS type A sorting domain-containing protein [Bacteroidia bacterium]